MRLLNVLTRQLEEFPGLERPPYAILSHTWGDDEVSFADISSSKAKNKAAYSKIEYACRQATEQKLKYCWIDTCCIDKNSSAELSEAINSMFSWYSDAVVCYAYLEDVRGSSVDADLQMLGGSREGGRSKSFLRHAEWNFMARTGRDLASKTLRMRKSLNSLIGLHLSLRLTSWYFGSRHT
jgi:hypothetical protein